MKSLLISLALVFFAFNFSQAQECNPDQSIPDSLLGVFPMPYDADENPDGGIKDTACIGRYFEFVFTTQVGDSFTLGETTLPLDSLWLDKTEAVDGLPKGLSYSCNPSSCVFKKASKGCVKLFGTPETGTEGIHQLKLSGKLYANGSSFGLNLSFPDPNIAPGEYALVVATKEQSPCDKMSVDPISSTTLKLYPNPAANTLNIDNSNGYRVKVYDVMGNEIVQLDSEGELTMDVAGWTPGIYLVQAVKDGQTVQSMVIIE